MARRLPETIFGAEASCFQLTANYWRMGSRIANGEPEPHLYADDCSP